MDKKTITITWHIDDVKSLNPNISDEQAFEVLCRAEKKHDANIGINWDVLEYHLDEVIES